MLLIERCSTKHGPLYAAVVDQPISAPRKLKELAKLFEAGMMQDRPCLLAAIGGARQSLSSSATERLEESANQAIERFAAVFSQGRTDRTLAFKGKPQHAAMSFFAMLQGLQTLCQLTNDTAAFARAVSTYIDSLTAN